MRTKNAKRLWPVPATLAVMAMAALLAFGLMATTGNQPAQAQADPCFTVESATASTQLCSVTGSEAMVKLTGIEATSGSDTNYFVYYPVGSGEDATLYPPGTNYLNGSDHDVDPDTPSVTGFFDGTASAANPPQEVAPIKFAYAAISLGPAMQGAEDTVPQSQTITVMGEPTDEKIVYVYGGTADPPDVASDAPEGSSKVLSNERNADTTLTITFLGPPSPTDADDSDVKRSQIMTEGPTLSNAADTDDDERTIATVTVIVQDAKAHELTGNVTLEVADPDGKAKISVSGVASAIKALRTEDDADTADFNEEGTAAFTVTGLPKTGGVKVPVTATVQTPTGPLTLTGNISRVGSAEMITATAYLCDPDNVITADDVTTAADDDPTRAIVETDICVVEARQLATKSDTDDPDPVAVVSPGDIFMIHSKVVDSLGQELKQSATDDIDLRAIEMQAEGEDKAFGVGVHREDEAVDADPDQNVVAQVAYVEIDVPAKGDIETGTYNFTVEDTRGNAEITVMVTVSGPPKNYAITGDMWIPLDGEKTYTVTATDENDNIPAASDVEYNGDASADPAVAAKYGITVRVRGVGLKQADDVVGLVGSMVDVNAAKGTGTFTILAPVEASQGDPATIRIIVNDVVKDTLTVYFGEAGAMPPTDGTTDPMDDRFTAMHTVMATSPSSGMVDVSWSEDAFDTDMVMLLQDGVVVMRMLSFNDAMHTFSDVDPGTYQVAVYSFTAGVADGGMLAFGMVMVE